MRGLQRRVLNRLLFRLDLAQVIEIVGATPETVAMITLLPATPGHALLCMKPPPPSAVRVYCYMVGDLRAGKPTAFAHRPK